MPLHRWYYRSNLKRNIVCGIVLCIICRFGASAILKTKHALMLWRHSRPQHTLRFAKNCLWCMPRFQTLLYMDYGISELFKYIATPPADNLVGWVYKSYPRRLLFISNTLLISSLVSDIPIILNGISIVNKRVCCASGYITTWNKQAETRRFEQGRSSRVSSRVGKNIKIILFYTNSMKASRDKK